MRMGTNRIDAGNLVILYRKKSSYRCIAKSDELILNKVSLLSNIEMFAILYKYKLCSGGSVLKNETRIRIGLKVMDKVCTK